MRLKDIADLKLHSGLARKVLKRVYHDGDVCAIRLGPLRGARLVYHPSVNFHAILGLWELEAFRFLQSVLVDGRLLGRESMVADVGANIGFYTLWFARRFRSVQAFEPAPEPQSMLAENLAANGAGNVTVIHAACGATNGTADFFLSHHHHASSLDASWVGNGNGSGPSKITVPVITLDSHFGETVKDWPDLIKMDIEGGGAFALPGAARCLAQKRPFLLIESHTYEEDCAVSDVLFTNDYAAYRLNTRKWLVDRTATRLHREGVWGTMFLCPAEKREDVSALL
jgi:FkbM family methyltransferase